MQLFHFHPRKRHLKKRTIALDPLPPPAYAVYARENDDNYGRPLRSIQNVMFTCWQCSIAATSCQQSDSTVLNIHRATVAARKTFCVYCSQLSIHRPATKETRPEAESLLSVSLLETGTRYRGRRPVASIAHWVKPVGYRTRSTAVPVNYISLRVFTGSTSISTGRIRARFGGSFHSRNRRHRRRRHFLRQY